jgi:hypothetical protein
MTYYRPVIWDISASLLGAARLTLKGCRCFQARLCRRHGRGLQFRHGPFRQPPRVKVRDSDASPAGCHPDDDRMSTCFYKHQILAAAPLTRDFVWVNYQYACQHNLRIHQFYVQYRWIFDFLELNQSASTMVRQETLSSYRSCYCKPILSYPHFNALIRLLDWRCYR